MAQEVEEDLPLAALARELRRLLLGEDHRRGSLARFAQFHQRVGDIFARQVRGILEIRREQRRVGGQERGVSAGIERQGGGTILRPRQRQVFLSPRLNTHACIPIPRRVPACGWGTRPAARALAPGLRRLVPSRLLSGRAGG